MPNDGLKKVADKVAKQAMKEAKKDLKKGLKEATSGKDMYDTPMKNAAIDYFKQIS
jgi:hypothetical protein